MTENEKVAKLTKQVRDEFEALLKKMEGFRFARPLKHGIYDHVSGVYEENVPRLMKTVAEVRRVWEGVQKGHLCANEQCLKIAVCAKKGYNWSSIYCDPSRCGAQVRARNYRKHKRD